MQLGRQSFMHAPRSYFYSHKIIINSHRKDRRCQDLDWCWHNFRVSDLRQTREVEPVSHMCNLVSLTITFWIDLFSGERNLIIKSNTKERRNIVRCTHNFVQVQSCEKKALNFWQRGWWAVGGHKNELISLRENLLWIRW